MSREEEIKKEAKNKYPYIKGLPQTVAHQDIFIEGAKWADKTQIERVLKFIFEYFYEHPHVNGHICTDSFESLEELEEELIKAMDG